MKILSLKVLVILFLCILQINCQFRFMFARLFSMVRMMPPMPMIRMPVPRMPVLRIPIPRMAIPRISFPKLSVPKISLPKLYASKGKYVVNKAVVIGTPKGPPKGTSKGTPINKQNPLSRLNNAARQMPSKRKFYLNANL